MAKILINDEDLKGLEEKVVVITGNSSYQHCLFLYFFSNEDRWIGWNWQSHCSALLGPGRKGHDWRCQSSHSSI